MKKFNILVLCPVYKPHSGGGAQYFPILISSILKFDYLKKLFLITEYHSDCKLITVDNKLIILRILPQRDTVKNKNFITHYIFYFLSYLIIFIFIPFIVLFYKIHIIHFTRYLTAHFAFLLKILKKIFSVKIILDLRTVVGNKKESQHLKKFKFVDKILSNSLSVKYQIDQINDLKEINHFLINPIIFRKQKGRNDIVKSRQNNDLIKQKYLLFVGLINDRKSIIECVEAFNKIDKLIPEYKFVIIGRNNMGQKFLNLIKNNKSINYLGEEEHETVLDYIECSELILQPSKFEGIPRVSLESLNFNKKILLPSCVPEFSKYYFFLPKEINSEQISKSILKIIGQDKYPIYDCNLHSLHNYRSLLNKYYTDIIKS